MLSFLGNSDVFPLPELTEGKEWVFRSYAGFHGRSGPYPIDKFRGNFFRLS